MRVVRVDVETPSRPALREAAELLRAGRLVAFPTETVYGLGAHALDEVAVQRIYEAKGRPARNPIIVHVANIAAARALSANWTDHADRIARKLWPGPITLVVRRHQDVPDIVTAGRDTVGLRVPAHPVALALLDEARIPIAAPSANPSTQVSPTTAQHVARGLGDRVDLILDAGPTDVGIESTVLDVSGAVPRILRPGMVSREMIAQLIGDVELAAADHSGETPMSPGLLGRHYAPRGRVALFTAMDEALARVREARAKGKRVGALVFEPLSAEDVDERRMPADASAYARELYATLHELDDAGCAVIVIERPPESPEWSAVADRLRRMVE